jgi:hypothetical protein
VRVDACARIDLARNASLLIAESLIGFLPRHRESRCLKRGASSTMVDADERAPGMLRGRVVQRRGLDRLPEPRRDARGLPASVIAGRLDERVPDLIVARSEHTLATGSDEPASASARRWC